MSDDETKLSVSVRLTPIHLGRLDEVVQELADDPSVQATGVTPTRHTAVRYILYEILGDEDWGTTEVVSFPGKKRNRPTLVVVEDDGEPAEEVTPAPNADAPTSSASDTPAPEEPAGPPPEVLDDNGHYLRSAMLEYYDQDPWEFSEAQITVHQYYDENGWIRVAGTGEGRTVQFYWNPDPAAQDLAVCPSDDGYGHTVYPQFSPDLGCVHLIPTDWGEDIDPNTIGDIGHWSP